MKITKDELLSVNEDPFVLFQQGIRAQETKKKYTNILKRTLCNYFEDILEGSFEERIRQFVKKSRQDPDWTLKVLLALAKKYRERTELLKDNPDYINPNSMEHFFAPVKKLCDMNDLAVAWKRIRATFPENDNNYQTRAWTRKEIQHLLKFTKGAIDKAIILIASSSGIRAGGFNFTWEDILPVYLVDGKLKLEITELEEEKAKIVCAVLIVYKGTNSQYPAFITPEAYNALMDYRKAWIKEAYREPKSMDPIFKCAGMKIEKMTPNAIKQRVQRVVDISGIRKPLTKDKRRHEVPTMNGFRRFFNKTNKEAVSKDTPLASLIKKEYMMNHVGLIKLDRNYFQTNLIELIEEYLNVVPSLTISDEERLRVQGIIKDETIKKKDSEKDFLVKDYGERLSNSERIIQELKKRLDSLES